MVGPDASLVGGLAAAAVLLLANLGLGVLATRNRKEEARPKRKRDFGHGADAVTRLSSGQGPRRLDPDGLGRTLQFPLWQYISSLFGLRNQLLSR